MTNKENIKTKSITDKRISRSLKILSFVAGFSTGWGLLDLGDYFRLQDTEILFDIMQNMLFPLLIFIIIIIIFFLNKDIIEKKGTTILLSIILPLIAGYIAFCVIIWGIVIFITVVMGVTV